MLDVISINTSTFSLEEKEIETILGSSVEVRINPFGRKLEAKEVVEFSSASIGIIAGTEPYSSDVIRQLKNLKFLFRLGVGVDNIDQIALLDQNVKFKKSSINLSNTVSEHTLGLILAAQRNIVISDSDIKSGRWSKRQCSSLNSSTVGVIGLGKIGKQVARYLHCFQSKVIAYEQNPDYEFCDTYDVEIVSLNYLLEESDVVTIHVGLSGMTTNLIDEMHLMMMKNSSIIVNTSRGGIINEKALIEVLKKNPNRYACLDVFDNEPYTGELATLNNVILTPHLAGQSIDVRRKMELEALEQIKGYLDEQQ